MLLQMIFWTTPALSNTRCHCTKYYKYPRILPKHHTWLKIQNSITIICGYLFGFSKFVSTFNIFFLLLCLHSIIYCKFYTLTNQSLLLWHKYLESLGKSDVFTHIFFPVCHGGRTRKRTIAQQSRRSSRLCESCQPAVTILCQ